MSGGVLISYLDFTGSVGALRGVDDAGHPLPVDITGGGTLTGLAVWGPDAAGTAPTHPPVYVSGLASTAAPAFVDGMVEPLSLALSGGLRVGDLPSIASGTVFTRPGVTAQVWNPSDDSGMVMRGAASADSNVTIANSGFAAPLLFATFNDVSPAAMTEDRAGNLRMSPERALLIGGVVTGGTTSKVITLDSSGDVAARMVSLNATGSDGFSNLNLGYTSPSGGLGSFTLLADSPHVFNGTSWDRQRSITGATSSTTGTGVAATAVAAKPYARYVGAGTATTKSGSGLLSTVTVGTPIAGDVITLYDNTAASGTVIDVITIPAAAPPPFTVTYELGFAVGLTINKTSTSSVVVTYR